MTGQLFSRREIAKIFGVKPRAVTEWRRKGLITPAFYVNGRSPRYTIEEIEKIAKVKNKQYDTSTSMGERTD